nr:MAG TPA: hypothetical protein [Caudoviricetes sp.]
MDRLNLQMINIETNGCAVQFRLGSLTDNKITARLTVYFKFNAELYFPIEDGAFFLDDFIDRKIPYLLLVPCENNFTDEDREILVQEAKKPNSPIISVYRGDKMGDVLDKLYKTKTIVYIDNGDVL